MPDNIIAFWNEYKARHAIDHDVFSIAEFGDSPELADTLAGLIRRGIKTATCSAYQAYVDENAALPEVGSLFIVLDSKRDPVCVCRTTEVRMGPFHSVDAAFAYDEGEDDRSLGSWYRAHRRFFGLSAAAEDSFEVVFERFVLIWPMGEGSADR